ncbi:hypothetical protein B0E43_19670 [Algoriphagus sp. A40]|nr:hypothetical protein B0E43_19670 [Algoriphagus sp. A40]
MTQKDQKVKTQQSSYRTRPDAGPLLRRATAPFNPGFGQGVGPLMSYRFYPFKWREVGGL